jgi:N-acetylglucosaminyldiphosphoundecaprenol N-acetyl-beta-D-mannosaminyltransferase
VSTQSSAALRPPQSAKVLGTPLAISNYEQVLAWMQASIAEGSKGWLTAAAVNLVMCALDRPEVHTANAGASLIVPDGQPLVWALHSLGHHTATRVYGPELMARFCAAAAKDRTPMYLYGGRDEHRLAQLCERLSQRFPGLRIAGSFSPPFRELTYAEQQQLATRIDASGAQVVWVGTGQPKQELWMAQMRPLLRAPLLVGVGAAFDFHAGLIAQAPPWMQRHGLEWLFRLSREPGRLWRRYATQNPRFIASFARQYASSRR